MPSLTDSLAALADYSAQIHTLSSANLAPSGPYTTAYLNSLHLNPASASSSAKRSRPNSRPSRGASSGEAGVLSLIRDAQESEVRLFRFIGEAEVAGVGRIKRVEKRDEGMGGRGGVGARDMKVDVEGRNEVEVMLRTALRLVDDYRPMPRARATIASLLDTHHTQLERVTELELHIEEASNTHANATSNTLSTSQPTPKLPSGSKPTPKLSFEEVVKTEEAALRKMESALIPLRQAKLASSTSSTAPIPDESATAFKSTSTLPSSPPPTSHPSRTPAKTPQSRDIRVTNSLVNGTTPRRARATPGRDTGGVLTEGFEFDRFSPLKFLGTPRARGRGGVNAQSTLREVMGSPAAGQAEELVGRGIFGRPRVTATGLGGWDGAASVGARDGGMSGDDDEDQTVRFTSGSISAPQERVPTVLQTETMPELEEEVVLPQEEIRASEPDGVLEGVRFRLPIVEQAIGKIREGLSEMLRQGLTSAAETPEGTEATITHLARLSRSDPSPPPSPSSHSTSTLSSTSGPNSGPPPQPITPQTILTAHLLLALLRADDGAVSMTDLKDDLGALARARGWESTDPATAGAGGGMVTKCIYHVVGKRVAKIDRKAGARVMFAL